MSMGICGKYPELQISNSCRSIDKRDYLHNHDSFLHDVADPGRDKVQQYIHTSLSASFYLHRSLPYGLDAASYKVDVDFGGISIGNQSTRQNPIDLTDVLFQLTQ